MLKIAEYLTNFFFFWIRIKVMSQKRIKRKIEWEIQNMTREKIENAQFSLCSNPFVLKLGDNITKW